MRVRLEILEELVKGLKEQCTGGCCPAAAEAGTGEQERAQKKRQVEKLGGYC